MEPAVVEHDTRNIVLSHRLNPDLTVSIIENSAGKSLKILIIQNFEEWCYQNRRQMQEIVPNIYLGPFASATKANVRINKFYKCVAYSF